MTEHRLTDYAAPNEFHPMREIDGVEVEVEFAEVTEVFEQNKTKLKSKITVGDIEYICYSMYVGKALMKVPKDAWPIRAKFSLVTKFGKTFWTFE